LTEVDGGADYYGRFAQGLPTADTYFPIGAWFRPAESQAQLDAYRAFGMNLFVGVENPELTDEAAIRASGLRTLIFQGERTRFDDLGSEVAGWLLDDEVDMTSGPGDPSTGTGGGYDVMRAAAGRAPDDGKLRYSGYGKGVLWWESDAEAAYFVNHFEDATGADAYWFTDPNERGTPRYGKASSYGWNIDRQRFLDGLDGQRKPIWAIIETGWPFTESAAQGGRRILPDELRAAVWHSLIAGARGIIYFDHNFGPGSCDGSIIRGECYSDTHDMGALVNAQIKRLAPVLNAPSADGLVSTAADVRTMAKYEGGKFYVFAGNETNDGRTATFKVPCVGDATATVLDEDRSIPIADGQFSDDFADGNAIHIYRIDGGTTCGLPSG